MLKREQPIVGKPAVAAGEEIRARRRELGMTLTDLAERSGLSVAFLSQIERNKASASIVSLINIGRALQVSATTFIEIPAGETHVRRGSDPQHIQMDSSVEYIQLGAGMKNQKMDAILMKIPPGHVFPVDQREGEDFLYVLKGELYSELGDRKLTLAAGDSMHFNSRTPHTASNRTDQEVLLLYVGTPSIFEQE